MRLIEGVAHLFVDRESLVEKYVEDESLCFFDRLDQISDKLIKGFCTQMICSTIGDAYDFFYFIQNDYNIFYRNVTSLDSETGQKLYKWFGFYHALRYELAGPRRKKALTDAMSIVFAWNRKDKRLFHHFARLRENCEPLFEVVFAKKMTRDVFKSDVSPIVLALASNLFYNSHHTFLSELEEMKVAL